MVFWLVAALGSGVLAVIGALALLWLWRRRVPGYLQEHVCSVRGAVRRLDGVVHPCRPGERRLALAVEHGRGAEDRRGSNAGEVIELVAPERQARSLGEGARVDVRLLLSDDERTVLPRALQLWRRSSGIIARLAAPLSLCVLPFALSVCHLSDAIAPAPPRLNAAIDAANRSSGSSTENSSTLPPVVQTFTPGCGDGPSYLRRRVDTLRAAVKALRPLHRTISPPRAGDWLAQHREPGQTFEQYLPIKPVRAVGKRSVIYVMPLGTFEKDELAMVTLAAEFLSHYFCLTVRLVKTVPLSVIPTSARRVHPAWGDHQVLTTHVLQNLLEPNLPGDAAALLALTSSDLWPGDGWNFVFGQATLRARVGVYSIYRNGDLSAGPEARRLFVRRTLKTASHETGHMFSLFHCTAFECNMCGCNHREESDRRPLYVCGECAAKICYATNCHLQRRYRRLAAFALKHGLTAEQAYYQRAAEALSP